MPSVPCTLAATHVGLNIWLSEPLGCFIKQAGINIHIIPNMWETPEIKPGLASTLPYETFRHKLALPASVFLAVPHYMYKAYNKHMCIDPLFSVNPGQRPDL